MRYAKVGGAEIAFRVFGDGAPNILLLLGEYIPVVAVDEEPRLARCLRRLASLGGVVVFDRRGVGLSDDPPGPPLVEHLVEDAVGVMDRLGIERSVVMAWNVSGPAAIRLAAEHPERVSALILVNTYARLVEDDDYPEGLPRDVIATTGEETTSTAEGPREFDFLRTFAPSVGNDERFRAWWDRVGHQGASPARANQLWQLLLETDERARLPEITAPTLVVARSGIVSGTTEVARYLADHIPGAKYVELPGADLIWWVGDSDAVLDEVESFLGRTGSSVYAQRKLATVLFFDVVESTKRAAELGDRRWREVLETYVDLARRHVDRGGGRLVSTSGDGALATFEMPADAVRSAVRIAEDVRVLGIEICAGVHTGEIEVVGGDVAGIGVHIAARVMDAAARGEVLVSRTVCDLVTGSGLRFAERGEHELKGVPGRWGLFAVEA